MRLELSLGASHNLPFRWYKVKAAVSPKCLNPKPEIEYRSPVLGLRRTVESPLGFGCGGKLEHPTLIGLKGAQEKGFDGSEFGM